MKTAQVSKTNKVINCLTNSDNGITASEARNRYGIKRLSTVMNHVKSTLETYGNWEVIEMVTPRGKTRYFANDIHPGTRKFGFDKNGKRYAL